MNTDTFPVLTGIQGLICDLDGTLVDSRHDLTTAVNAMRADFGLAPLSFETITSYIGNGAAKLVERSLSDASVNPAYALQRFTQHYAAHLADQTRCYPGVPETLAMLVSSSIKCAVATNKPEDAARSVLRSTGLEPYFDPVVGGDTYPALKPDPYPVQQIINHWQLAPAQVLMIGDHVTDIAAAHAAGLLSVFLTCGYGHTDTYCPDITLDSFSDITALLGFSDRA